MWSLTLDAYPPLCSHGFDLLPSQAVMDPLRRCSLPTFQKPQRVPSRPPPRETKGFRSLGLPKGRRLHVAEGWRRMEGIPRERQSAPPKPSRAKRIAQLEAEIARLRAEETAQGSER